MSSCKVDACGKDIVARGMCRKHYLQAWRAKTLDQSPVRDHTVFECPPTHTHDLETCWAGHGCRCEQCRRLRKLERHQRRARLLAYGRTDELRPERVPVGLVREHVITLMVRGGLERIADAAQVPRSLLLDIYFGPRGKVKKQRISTTGLTVGTSSAARILALTPNDIAASVVPATGAVRRLQALVVCGYSESELAARLGMQIGNFSQLILGHRPKVRAARHEAVRALFNELWSVPKTVASADVSRRLAKKHRWVGPLAWDDIDDPSERPNLRGDREKVGDQDLDEIAIELAMGGERVKLTAAERREAIARLHAARFSDRIVAERLHIAQRTVLRARNIPVERAEPTDDIFQRAAA